MFTIILAAMEAFGNSKFDGLYIGTFVLDAIIILGLIKHFN